MIGAVIAASVAVGALAAQVASCAIVAARLRPGRARAARTAVTPAPVTVVQPLCGVDATSAETLDAVLTLDHSDYETLFCVADPHDPIIALAERRIKAHPNARAKVLVGDDKISKNPKLNNVVKGWRAAATPWVAMVDSNLLPPPDYLAHLLGAWRADTGVVCAPPIGVRAEGFASAVECAFLNSYQARWQFTADSIGLGFAQGKTLFFRKDVLEAGGGVEALGGELAEDAAATKVVRRLGLRVRLASASFPLPLGRRRWRDVWGRQVRWARLRRATFVLPFAPEILTTGASPILCAALAAPGFGFEPGLAALGAAVIWYGSEAAMTKIVGWPLDPRIMLAALARDAVMPWLWLQAWFGDDFEWRGHAMSVAEPARR